MAPPGHAARPQVLSPPSPSSPKPIGSDTPDAAPGAARDADAPDGSRAAVQVPTLCLHESADHDPWQDQKDNAPQRPPLVNIDESSGAENPHPPPTPADASLSTSRLLSPGFDQSLNRRPS